MGRGQGPEHGESMAPPDVAGGEQAGAAPNGHWGRCARCWPFRAAKSCPHPRQTAVGPGTCGIRGLRSTWVRGDWGGERFGSRRAGAVGPGLAVHGGPGGVAGWPMSRSVSASSDGLATSNCTLAASSRLLRADTGLGDKPWGRAWGRAVGGALAPSPGHNEAAPRGPGARWRLRRSLTPADLVARHLLPPLDRKLFLRSGHSVPCPAFEPHLA